MRITVKTLNSTDHVFNVEPEMTILNFKQHISGSINIAADKIRLIFRGCVLEDSGTVTSYALNDATVHAVEKLPNIPPPPPVDQNSNRTSNRRESRSQTRQATEDSRRRQEFFREQDISGTVSRVINAISSSLNELSPNSSDSVEDRINLAIEFLNHAHSIYESYISRENIINFDNLQENFGRGNESTDIGRLGEVTRFLSDLLHSLGSVVETYSRFLRLTCNDTDRAMRILPDYQFLSDTANTMMHSISHSLHLISDLMVFNRNLTNGENQFGVVTPRLIGEQVIHQGQSGNFEDIVDHSILNSSSVQNVRSRAGIPSTTEASTTSNNAPQNHESLAYFVAFQLPQSQVEDSSATSSQPQVTLGNNLPTVTGYSLIYPAQPVQASSNNRTSSQQGVFNNMPSHNLNPRVYTDVYNHHQSDSGLNSTMSQQQGSNTTHVSATSSRTNNRNNYGTPRDRFLSCQSYLANLTQPTSVRSILFRRVEDLSPTSRDETTNQTNSAAPANVQQPSGTSFDTQIGDQLPENPSLNLDRSSSDPSMHFFVESNVSVSSNIRNRQTSTASRQPSSTAPAPQSTASNVSQPVNWTTQFKPEHVNVIQEDINKQNSLNEMKFSNGYIAGNANFSELLRFQSDACRFLESPLADTFINSIKRQRHVNLSNITNAINDDDILNSLYKSLIKKDLSQNIKNYDNTEMNKYTLCGHKHK